MPVVLGSLSSFSPSSVVFGIVLGAFDDPDPPWIGKAFGTIIAVALLIALFAWSVFGLVDLARRDDIGPIKKLLWLVAFVLSAGIALVVYGAVRFSSTDGHPGW